MRPTPLVEDIDWSGTERRIVPANGVDLACWHRPGHGNRWVLWLHGACGNHLMWGRQLDAVPGVDHLFLDVRGQGESVMHTGRRVAFPDVVDDVGRVLDAFDVDSAVVVGHSWGGNPAQEFSFRHAERTDGLVMVGAWGQLRPMSERELRQIKVMTMAYRVVPWRLVGSVNSRVCSENPATQALVKDALLATGRQVFLDLGLSAYEAVHDVDQLPPIPTLLVRGALDAPKLLEPIYRDLQAKNPNAREVVIPGTKHLPMVDTPDAFNGALAEFLATT